MDLRDYRDRGGASDILREIRRYVPRFATVVLLLLAILVGSTAFYSIEASSSGVILRFGEYSRTVDPGLHFKWPWPVETCYEVPVDKIQTLEFGFRTEKPGRVTEYAMPSGDDLDVAEILTGDLNLAHVEWSVQYRISDAFKYLFENGNAKGSAGALPSGADDDVNSAVPDLIRDVSESVMRNLVGDSSVDSVLTVGRDQIATDAKQQTQEMLDALNAGVDVVAVKLQATSPPEKVKDAFQDVNRARQNKERSINQAQGERNRVIPAARGRRDQIVFEAEGYRERSVLEIQGKTEAFLSQLEEYEKSPEVTRTRLYLEAMQDVLGQVGAKTVVDDSLGGLLPLMNLDTSPEQTVRPQEAQR